MFWWGKSIEGDSGGIRDYRDPSRLVDCVKVSEYKLAGCCRGKLDRASRQAEENHINKGHTSVLALQA